MSVNVLAFVSFAAITNDPNFSGTYNNHISFLFTLHVGI